MNLDKELLSLKEKGEAPEWLGEEGFQTLKGGYLLPGETPCGMYRRVAKGAAKQLNKPELESKFYDAIYKNWLCLSSPVSANMGAERGLPISCYSQHIADTTLDIFKGNTEAAILSKYGGGMGAFFGDIRPAGSPISGGGTSSNVINWMRVLESSINSVSQAGVRRGSVAAYLPISHGDFDAFLDLRRTTGDLNQRCITNGFHHGVCIDDQFMEDIQNGHKEKRRIWSKLLKTRQETGEPYIVWIDQANKNLPQAYINNNLKISTSNLCSEIFLHTSKDYTFVCCLSSLNLVRYEEWKNTDIIKLAIYFLDAVMSEFIQKAKNIEGFEKAVRFAENSRALGLGVIGYHSLLQSKNLPFDSFDSMRLNVEIFKRMKEQSYEASCELAKEYGEPLWCKNTGMRNTHTLAVAPTVSNALISGGFSQGIEPIVANVFTFRGAKGTWMRKNPMLEAKLEEMGKNDFETWNQINKDSGSVKNLDFLSPDDKMVFLSAREINQFSIVRAGGARQKYIDQGQSINLFFNTPNNPTTDIKKKLGKYIHQVHLEAYTNGLKSLYYCKSESALRGDSIFRDSDECLACHG